MISLGRIRKVIIRWFWLALAPVVIVALYLVLTYEPPATSYQVVLQLAVGGEPAEPLSADYDRYYAWLSSEYIANGLSDIAVTRGFAAQVSEQLAKEGLTVSASRLRTALASDNTQSLTILYVTWPNPEELRLIAPVIARTLIDSGSDFYPQMRNIGTVARVIDLPDPHPIAPSLRHQLLGPALRLILAGAFGIGLALVTHYLDPFVRATEDIESQKVPVLVQIPPIRSGSHRSSS